MGLRVERQGETGPIHIDSDLDRRDVKKSPVSGKLDEPADLLDVLFASGEEGRLDREVLDQIIVRERKVVQRERGAGCLPGARAVLLHQPEDPAGPLDLGGPGGLLVPKHLEPAPAELVTKPRNEVRPHDHGG
jgi:hypothetical protein